MKYEDYEAGNNCIKVTGWNENGKIAIYEDSDAANAEISVNTDGLKYNKNANWYYIEDEISTLSGSISNSNIIKNLSYKIKDLNNDVSIIAEKKNGEIVKKSVCFMNINVNNMENMDVDLNDNDGDGLNNYFESLYGTNMNEVDTDGDGLSDFSEIVITGTNPLIQDTDNNGTTDGNEDFD